MVWVGVFEDSRVNNRICGNLRATLEYKGVEYDIKSKGCLIDGLFTTSEGLTKRGNIDIGEAWSTDRRSTTNH